MVLVGTIVVVSSISAKIVSASTIDLETTCKVEETKGEPT
jgi:shikimate kinase